MQQNERKKWIHCFEDVTAVLCICSLSEYDEMMFEVDSQNRMSEALSLFEEIVKYVAMHMSKLCVLFSCLFIFSIIQKQLYYAQH